MESFVHRRQRPDVISGDGFFSVIQGCADGSDVRLGGEAAGQARAFDFDQSAGGEGLARFHQIQRRHHGADAGAAYHQALQRQPCQGLADAGQTTAIKPAAMPGFTLSAYGKNLTNNAVILGAFIQSNASAVSWAPPRTFGFNIAYDF